MRLYFLLLMSFVCAACNGRGSGTVVINQDYSGTWELIFNLSSDECGVLAEDSFSFSDQHIITQDTGAFLVDAESGQFTSSAAQVRDDGSLLIEENLEGDLFGDGIFCSYTNAVSYLDRRGDTADTLFLQRLNCADGFLCESRGIGQATLVN